MLAKLSKYAFEIIAGIAIFIAIIYFLPNNKVQIPDIGELKLETVDLAFVIEEDANGEWLIINEQWSGNNEEPEIIQENESNISIQEEAEAIVIDIIETEYLAQNTPIDINTNNSLSGSEKDIDTNIQELETRSYNSCLSPWNTRINHGDSVLAYAQRSDDPSVCNVQRRVCNDWVLGWSFLEPSCREYIWLDQEKQVVISYNSPNINQFIQPQNRQQNNISSNQFIPAQSNNLWSNSRMGSSGIRPFVDNYEFAKSNVPTQWQRPFTDTNNSVSSSSTVRDGTTCITPRWEEVRNGQFVKAYRFDRWFSNMPCEVQLRYCVQTNLEWSFAYPSCQHYDIALEDYMIGHYDPNVPSLQQLAEILHGSADAMPYNYGKRKPTVWERIQWFFQRLF
jgi:hypothetical protein